MFLMDTDFIIALTFPGESTHKKAKKIAEKYFHDQDVFYLDLVLQECATVISRKYSQEDAVAVSKKLKTSASSILKPSIKNLEDIWVLFYKQKKKNISFIDCANVVLAKRNGLKLLSFDGFYKQFPEINL